MFAFPEIIFGWKPWSDKSTDARLPASVADIAGLTVRYQVDVEANGTHNLTLAAWLTTSGTPVTGGNPEAIAAEVVMWLDASPGFDPPGTRVEPLTTTTATFELWENPQHGDRGDGRGWDLYYLRAPKQGTPMSAGTVEMEPALFALTALGKLRPELWVASVEFGSELLVGSGTVWVREFDVTVKMR